MKNKLALAGGVILISAASASAQAPSKIDIQKPRLSSPFYTANAEKVAQTRGSKSVTPGEALAAIKTEFNVFFNNENYANPENVQYICDSTVLGSTFKVPFAAINRVHYYGYVTAEEVKGGVILITPPTEAMVEFFTSKNLKWLYINPENMINPGEVQMFVGSFIISDLTYLYDLNSDPYLGISSIKPALRKAYPNPIQHDGTIRLQLSLTSRSNVKIEIFNSIGQLVFEGKTLVEPGDKEISVPLNGLASGLYILKASDADGKKEFGNQKIVIQ